MSALLTREAISAPLLAMPLNAPDLRVAMDHIMFMAGEILSAGTGRRRRVIEPGRRSDFGYVVMHQVPAEGRRQLTAFKTVPSIRSYLVANLDAPAADHWAAVQSSQWRARRDGKVLSAGFTAAQTRHLLGIVVDLDGSRMDPLLRRLLTEDTYAFRAALEERLVQLGLTHYRLIRSGPEGVHLCVPVRRPDGKCLRATEKNVATWERVAKGLHRYLEQFGADANACKLTQPFVIPGLPRAKHAGFIPFVMGGRDGAPADLYALLRRLSSLRLVMAKDRVPTPTPGLSEAATDVQAILADIRERAAGVSRGARNQVAHDLAVFLLCKGAGEAEAWEALTLWNRRNDPPLPPKELRECFRSAQRCPGRYPRQWVEMQQATWWRLRGLLGLPAAAASGYRRAGRWRPITPAKAWEERKRNGREHYEEVAERLLRFVAGEGGSVQLAQAEICDRIDTNRTTLRAVLARLEAAGRLVVTARRGRAGTTVVSLPDEAEAACDEFTDNVSSGISTEGVQQGAWVGPVVREIDLGSRCASPSVPAGGPWELLRLVVARHLGVDLRDFARLPVGGIWAAGEWRAVATSPAGRDLLRQLDRSGGLDRWRRRLQRGWEAATVDPGG